MHYACRPNIADNEVEKNLFNCNHAFMDYHCSKKGNYIDMLLVVTGSPDCMTASPCHLTSVPYFAHVTDVIAQRIYAVSGKKWPPKTYCTNNCKPIPIQLKFYTHEDISISNKRQCVSSQYNTVRRNMRYEIARGVKI
jgi:hypothetical protein